MPHLDSEVSQGLNSTKSRPKSALFILTDHHRKKHTIDRDRIERIQRGIVIRTSITRKRWSDTRPGSVNVDTLLSCRLGPRSSRERRNCSTLFAMAKVTDWKEWPAKLYSDRKSRGIIPCQGFLPPPPPPPPLSLSLPRQRIVVKFDRQTRDRHGSMKKRSFIQHSRTSLSRLIQYLSYLNSWHTMPIKKLELEVVTGGISLFDKVKRRWTKWWQFINSLLILDIVEHRWNRILFENDHLF